MFFSEGFADEVSEKVDVLSLSQKQSTPGGSIPETTVQSDVTCVLIEERSDIERSPSATRRAFPVVPQDTLYNTYFLDGMKPEVSQILKRSNGERLTVMNEPREAFGVIFFLAQKTG